MFCLEMAGRARFTKVSRGKMYHKSVSCILVYNWINNRLLSFTTKGYCSETILRIYLNFGGLRESGAMQESRHFRKH